MGIPTTKECRCTDDSDCYLLFAICTLLNQCNKSCPCWNSAKKILCAIYWIYNPISLLLQTLIAKLFTNDSIIRAVCMKKRSDCVLGRFIGICNRGVIRLCCDGEIECLVAGELSDVQVRDLLRDYGSLCESIAHLQSLQIPLASLLVGNEG